MADGPAQVQLRHQMTNEKGKDMPYVTVLDLREFDIAGHSMGGGETARYLGVYGTGRVRRAAIISGIPGPEVSREGLAPGRRGPHSTRT